MPRTKKQNQEIKDIRKESIVRASLYLFAYKGYAAVKIDEITKAAKCSHGLVYHYFQTKEDIFHSVMDYSHALTKENIGDVNKDQKAKFVLHDLLENICNGLKNKNTDIACMIYLVLNLFLQRKYIPKPKDINKVKNHKRLYDEVYALIEQGQKEGDFIKGNPHEFTIAILSMVKGLAYNRLHLDPKHFVCPNSSIIMNIVNIK